MRIQKIRRLLAGFALALLLSFNFGVSIPAAQAACASAVSTVESAFCDPAFSSAYAHDLGIGEVASSANAIETSAVPAAADVQVLGADGTYSTVAQTFNGQTASVQGTGSTLWSTAKGIFQTAVNLATLGSLKNQAIANFCYNTNNSSTALCQKFKLQDINVTGAGLSGCSSSGVYYPRTVQGYNADIHQGTYNEDPYFSGGQYSNCPGDIVTIYQPNKNTVSAFALGTASFTFGGSKPDINTVSPTDMHNAFNTLTPTQIAPYTDSPTNTSQLNPTLPQGTASVRVPFPNGGMYVDPSTNTPHTVPKGGAVTIPMSKQSDGSYAPDSSKPWSATDSSGQPAQDTQCTSTVGDGTQYQCVSVAPNPGTSSTSGSGSQTSTSAPGASVNPAQFSKPNFLKYAVQVFSKKFPFDIFGSIPPGVPGDCPSFTFFGQTAELCIIKDVLTALKWPTVLSFLIWGVMSI